jgi:hypothetical protein
MDLLLHSLERRMPGGEGRGTKDVVQGSWIFRALGVSVGGGLSVWTLRRGGEEKR